MKQDQNYLDGLDESEKVALKTKMYGAIREEIQARQTYLRRRKAIWQNAKIAASVSLLLASTVAAWQWAGRTEMVYRTGANEILELVLPDSSSVTLNSNSTLSYTRGRFSDFDRKVELEGEAFFSIEKDPDGKPFEVNGDSNLGITVLGTKFSVKNSQTMDKVTLIEGSVMLGFKGKNGTGERLMAPGESVKLDQETQLLKSTKLKHPEKLIAWKKRRLTLDNESLLEVLGTLAELYDLALDAEIPTSETPVSGSLPLSDDPRETLENLALLFNTTIELNNRIIILKNTQTLETIDQQ